MGDSGQMRRAKTSAQQAECSKRAEEIRMDESMQEGMHEQSAHAKQRNERRKDVRQRSYSMERRDEREGRHNSLKADGTEKN